MKPPGKSPQDLQEELRQENEELKLKLRARYGEAFEMTISDDLPPDVGNEYLKSMMAFEDDYLNPETTTIYERIGQPATRSVEELQPAEMGTALSELLKLLDQNQVVLHISDGPYPDAVIYRFITAELFNMKVEKRPIPGLISNFTFEDFHPNHKTDISKRTETFVNNWFEKKFTEYSTELSWYCITPDGDEMIREELVAKMNAFFKCFTHFNNPAFTIGEIQFELRPDNLQGVGHADGELQYDAVRADGRNIHIRGSFKLYLQLEDNWWSIFYFVMPGFDW